MAGFDGGSITSDAGALLLGAADRAIGLVERFAGCFAMCASGADRARSKTLVGQRVFAIALGYEDLNDHDELRHDPVMAVLAGKLCARRKDCAPVAGKIDAQPAGVGAAGGDALSQDQPTRRAQIETLFVDLFLEAFKTAPKRSSWIWMPPTTRCTAIRKGVFSTAITIATATCRSTSSVAGICWRRSCGPPISTRRPGAVEEMARIVGANPPALAAGAHCVARRFRVYPRGLMGWCEANGVDYIFGLAQNDGSPPRSPTSLPRPRGERHTGQPARRFKDFSWTTRNSWSRERRVIAKAEWTEGEANPRFIVTSLAGGRRAAALYEDIYCARGEMENRIKECQLDLFADRTSTATMRANQLRLWFASMAYVLVARSVAWRCSNRTGQRHLWHHPPKALQDRRPGEDQRSPHQVRHGLGLSLSARIRRRPPTTDQRRGAMTKQKKRAIIFGTANHNTTTMQTRSCPGCNSRLPQPLRATRRRCPSLILSI